MLSRDTKCRIKVRSAARFTKKARATLGSAAIEMLVPTLAPSTRPAVLRSSGASAMPARMASAGNDLHQRAFAGAVLTHDGVNAPALDVKADVLQGAHARIGLGDPSNL